MKTDQNSNMQGTLNKRISMKKRRNAKRALLALNLVAVIFTTTVFSNPVSVLSEEVSTDTVQSIENSPGTDAQIAEQADVQQNTAEAAQAVEAPAAEAPAAENSAEAAKAEEPSGVNAPAENAMSAEMNAAEDGVVSTDDGASSASAVQSADTSSASNGSFEDAGAGNTDGTKDGIIENDAEGLNEAEGTAANEESEDAASQEQLTYEDEHVKISVSYTDGRAFTADSILTRTYLDSDEKNAVLSAVNAQISKGNSADTVSDTAENTESSGSAPVASTTATTVEYSVAGFHALMLAAKNQDGSDTTTEGDVTFSAEFKKGLNDAGYASREETTENNEAGGDGSLTTTTTRCETSWKIYTVTEKNLTDITDITDAHNTHYEMDENGTLKSASFRGALPQTVAFVQIVKKTVTETTTQKETEKATEKETQKVTEKYTEKITGKAAEKTTETETEKEDVKAEVPASAAMPAVAFDQKVTTENGTVMVHIDAEEGAFEEGTSMTVTPVTRHDILDKAIDAAGGKGAAAAMDITFTKADGTKTEPLKPIHVKMISPVLNHAEEAHVVHVADSGTIDVVARKSDGKTIESTSSEAASSDAKNAVSFESDSFSVYAIVYTVDFHWEVDGQMYEFSLPGGGFISFSDLIEVLGVAKTGENDDVYLPGEVPGIDNQDANGENNTQESAESADNTGYSGVHNPMEVPGINDQDATGENGSAALTLDGVVVSEKTREFVADVKSVVFSSPELVDVSKVESETTVGGIKESRGLDVQYSAELTEEQIAEINAQTVVAGDWALISVQPFESTESLTVTMKTGEVFEIRVTDAQLKKTVKTASGETWEITITYDDSAEIPKDAELRVEEILPEDERYEQYYQQSLEKISVGEVPDTIEDESGSEMIDETAETASEEAATTTSYAHIFDIQIWAGDQQIEPASGSTVSVSIKLLDAPENEDTNLQVVHFGKDGLEVMELAENNDETKAGGTELNFVTDEFSVYAIVGTETITTQFTTGDGSTYEVVVSFDKEAGIPENAKLEVSEVTEADTDYYEYVSRTADAVDSNITDLNYIKLLDIKIIDENGNKVALNAPVDVQIRLLDTEETNYVQVVHFAESTKVEVIDPSVDVNTVCFETSGFSIYAIVDLEEEDHVARVQYTFQNSDGSSFEFLDASGNKVDYQIIKNGEALEQVDIPAIDASNQTFRGWFIYLKDGGNYVATGEEIDFGEAISISTGAGETTITATTVKIANEDNTSGDTGKYPDYTVYLRPVYGNVHYLTFYNSIDGAPVYSRIQVDHGSTYDISQMEAVPPDATVEYDEDGNPVVTSLSYVFTGWSSTAGSTLETSDDPDSRTEISNTNVTVNSDMEFYPVFRLSHWLNFYSAPTGSGATYFPSVYILNGQTTASAKPTADPEWQGHEFVGWFLTEDTDYLSDGETADDAYQFNGTISSDTTLYAHWNAGTANVTVVYWRENATDDKSVWEDTTGKTKSYEYYSQANYTATVGTEFAFSKDIILDLGRGFTTNTIKSDASVKVQPDGSSVLNVYIDRDLIRYLFYYGGTIDTNPGFNNEVYANKEDLEGTMLVMTGLQGQALSMYGYTFPNVGDYEGYVWSVIWTNDKTLMSISTSFGAATESDPYEYASTIHEKRFYVTSKSANGHFERYYQNTDGETYETEPRSEFWYDYCGSMNFSVSSNKKTFEADHVRLFLDDVNGIRTYFKPVDPNDQNKIPESTESEEEQWTKVTPPAVIPTTAREYVLDDEGNICQDYNAVVAAAADELALYPNNVMFYKDKTGVYKRVFYGMEIYYRRNQFTVKFIDTYDGTLVDELGSKQVYYEESLSTVKPGEDITLEPPTQEYKWDGKYYADKECTAEFDWTQTMPGKDVPVYIKWNPIYYWVKVDPDGGILSDTESTWFWETKGSIIEEYTDVVRPYVENSDGAYYYHYDEFNEKDPDGTQPSTRKAYYTTDEGEATDTETKYAVDGTAYSFVGWYEVDKETGQLIGLYNFDAGITGNTYLKAVWRSVGVYTVKYSQDGVTAEGDPLLDDDEKRISTNGTAPVDKNQYIDKSYTSVAGSISAPEGYVFTGWYYNGAMYNAGDVLLIQSEMANDNREIWLYPVFVPIEDIPVEVTQITFHGNGHNSHTEMETSGNVTVHTDNEDPTIVIYPEIINKTVSLEGSNQYFSRPGFVFKGWALSAEATTPWLIYDDSTNKYSLSTDPGAQVKAVAADNIGATEEDGNIVYANDLYAIWEIKIVIRKVDISNTDKNLQDAVFNLYKVDDEGEDELLFEDIKSGADGLLYYNNSSELQLPLGTYHLVETSAPAGYNIKTSPVNITVSKSGITYDESTTLSSSGNGITYDEETGVYKLLVTNSAGEELPHTGGTGTLPYTLGGIAMILASAAMYGFRMRRKRKEVN